MTRKNRGDAEMCTCGHVHREREQCTAIVSGYPMVNYCVCPGLTRPGDHIKPAYAGEPQ